MDIKCQGHSLTFVQGHSDWTFSNFFSSKNTRPIEAIFHVEPSWDGIMKVSTNGLCHMTKMAAMPIYDTKLSKVSLEPKGRWTWNLVCSIEYSSTTKFVQMMPLGWHWPILRQVQIWPPLFLYGKKCKQWIFSENIVVYDIKVGRCSQLNEYMKLYEYQRSRSFIDLGPNHSDSLFLVFIYSVTADFNISSALKWAIQDQWSSCFLELWPFAKGIATLSARFELGVWNLVSW